MQAWRALLLAAGPTQAKASTARALAWLKTMEQPRLRYPSARLAPNDPAIDRHDSGPWSGVWTLPPTTIGTPYTPVMLLGPLWFPLVAAARADFSGQVDAPFASMDGWTGRRQMTNPSPPPDFIDDPGSLYGDGGINWGRYFVLGSVGGTKQFVAPVGANLTWSATVASVPAGAWSFQLITYATASDAGADTNRLLVGNPWLESERPGDVRDYYTAPYTAGAPQFTGVVLTAGATNDIGGTLAAFTPVGGRTYQILVTNEADVEYAWALHPVAGPGAFVVSKPGRRERRRRRGLPRPAGRVSRHHRHHPVVPDQPAAGPAERLVELDPGRRRRDRARLSGRRQHQTRAR
jgi:hypothetical protein